MLPGDGEWHESDVMLQAIIAGMVNLGCHPLIIRARLVGGANIMNLSAYQVGHRNIVYVKKELKKKGIIVNAEDIGGEESRTARLNIESGILSINNSNKDFYSI